MVNYCIISHFVFLFTGQLSVGASVGITIGVILPTLSFLGLIFICVCYVAGVENARKEFTKKCHLALLTGSISS